jgi:DNA-damage-inducible protein D
MWSTALNQSIDVANNFTEVRKVAGRAGPSQLGFELSRFAAYLVAMNGDPHIRQKSPPTRSRQH